jgi:hypothetical protein
LTKYGNYDINRVLICNEHLLAHHPNRERTAEEMNKPTYDKPTYDELEAFAKEKGIVIDLLVFYNHEICVRMNSNWERELLREDASKQLIDFLEDRESDIDNGIEDFNQLATVFEHIIGRPPSADIAKT